VSIIVIINALYFLMIDFLITIKVNCRFVFDTEVTDENKLNRLENITNLNSCFIVLTFLSQHFK